MAFDDQAIGFNFLVVSPYVQSNNLSFAPSPPADESFWVESESSDQMIDQNAVSYTFLD